jgi:hypothetical protein
VVIEDGVLVGQIATQQDYPSLEAEKVTKSLASADLGVLWTPIGPLQMHNLYREIHGTATPTLNSTFVQYLELQLQMLHTYQYPLAAADPLLATHRQQVMSYHERVLTQLRRGDIETWDKLYSQDILFSQYPDD